MEREQDNVFGERLWRSFKYVEAHLHAYETVRDTQVMVTRYTTLYNQLRPHRVLDGRTSDLVYCDSHACMAHHQAPLTDPAMNKCVM